MNEIIEIINEYCNNNGSFILFDKLKERWMERNPSREGDFREMILALLSEELIHMEFDRVYLERVWRQENFTAEKLYVFQQTRSTDSPKIPEEISVGDIVLFNEQREAVISCLKNRLTLLLAPAGSGKTTIAQAILQYSGAMNPLLCSPTGKAAMLLGNRTNRPAGTVHRVLGTRKIEDFLEVDQMQKIDLIIVDEATMLTIDMLAGVLRAASDGCRIVLMGDPNQLPAIGPGNVVNDLTAMRFSCVYLTSNHRISGKGVALKENVIGYNNICLPWQLSEDESFRRFHSEDEMRLMEMVAQEAVSRYRQGESVKVLALRNADVMEINRRIQRQINQPLGGAILHSRHFDYMEGDRVIIVENDYQQGCFNGESGILHLEGNGFYSVELDDGRCPTWSELIAPTKILPAYAITVHRSQGSEYDTVLIYAPRCSGCILHRNSFYTGISRAKKQLLLFADPAAVGFALRTPLTKRNSALVEKLKVQKLLNSAA